MRDGLHLIACRTPLVNGINMFFVILLLFGIRSETIQVGPTRTYETLSDALPFVSDGDVIEIDAGVTYTDYNTINNNEITIIGVGGGRAHFNMDTIKPIPNGKAAMVITGDDVTIENIEFSWCWVADDNGAGIRWEGGKDLTVRNCYFHDNERSLMTGPCLGTTPCHVIFEYSHIERSYAHGSMLGHNIYIGNIEKFTFRHSISEMAPLGHSLKSRASENYITYNTFRDYDYTSGKSIDIPEGGLTYIVGNVFQKGPNSDTITISYAGENTNNPIQECYISYNTLVDEHTSGTTKFLDSLYGSPTGLVTNNILLHYDTLLYNQASSITYDDDSNFHCTESECDGCRLQYQEGGSEMDYHVYNVGNSSFAVVGKAVIPEDSLMVPTWQYDDTEITVERTNAVDLGAYQVSSQDDDDDDGDGDMATDGGRKLFFSVFLL